MLNNNQIAEYLIRGRLPNSNDYIVGTGVRIGRYHTKVYDETIHDLKKRWVDVVPGTIEKCIGLVDKVGNPVFDNDVLSDTKNGIKIIIQYDNENRKWEGTYIISGMILGDTNLVNLPTLITNWVVMGRYENGKIIDGVKYNKPIYMEAYNDTEQCD